MRKINKHTLSIIIAVIIALLIIGIVIMWMLFQYKTLTSPGSDTNDVHYTSGEKIPSVSGTGQVNNDGHTDTAPVENKKDTQTKKETGNGGTTNTTPNRSSGDPVYTSPSANGKGSSYKHVIDTHCYDSIHDKMVQQANQQMDTDMDKLDAKTRKDVVKLLNDIDAAKPAIRAATPTYSGEYAQYNQNTQVRDSMPRPSPDDEPTKIVNYANAWSDDTHKFGDRANKIYKTRDDQVAVIGKKYNITCS